MLLLDEAVPLLTLTGPGGVGKTRLALAIAHEVATSFAGGALFIDLSGIRDPALVLPTLAQALGVRETGDRPLAARLAAALRTEQRLLVLDNCEQVLGAAPEIAALLEACPAVQVLATSRAALRIRGEHRLPVEPLPVPAIDRAVSPAEVATNEAVILFVQRARADDPGFELTEQNAGTVAEISRRLDGLPLAIELAAARTRLFPPEALLRRLGRRLPLLTGGPRDSPARLRTMRDAIAWSYNLLEPAEQILFRRLGVFVGGFPLDAAEGVAGEPGRSSGDVLSGIESLVQQSLVRRIEAGTPRGDQEPRFGMLETVREFALELLAASGEAEIVRGRHAAWGLALVEHRDPLDASAWQGSWIAILEAELPNLRVTLDWYCQRGAADEALRLAGALGQVWWVRSRLSEAIGWLDRVLASDGGPTRARALALIWSGAFHWTTGEEARGEQRLAEARRIAGEIGADDLIAFTNYFSGQIPEFAGDYATAWSRFEEGLAAARRVANPFLAGLLLKNLGASMIDRGEIDRAADYAAEALALLAPLGAPRQTAIVETILAWVDVARADFDGAARLFGEALTTALDLADPWWVANSLIGYARLALANGAPARSARLLGAADAQREITGRSALPFPVQHEAVVAAVRDALGITTFAALLDAGRNLPLHVVLAETHSTAAASEGVVSEWSLAKPFDLSPREIDVLRLLVAGKTDQAIGDALFISKRTVSDHTRSIYAKLGVANRAEAAAFAVRERLV